MKVSYNWLKELVNIEVNPKKLSDEMSLYSVEVEAFSELVGVKGLVIGYVETCEMHPNSILIFTLLSPFLCHEIGRAIYPLIRGLETLQVVIFMQWIMMATSTWLVSIMKGEKPLIITLKRYFSWRTN